MMMRKDINSEKYKLIIGKLESYLKSCVKISQETIFKVCQLSDQELNYLQDSERNLDDQIISFDSGIIDHIEKQFVKNRSSPIKH